MFQGGSGTESAIQNPTPARYAVELLFSQDSASRASVADTVAPAAPAIGTVLNAAGFVSGDTPVITGSAEANSTVDIVDGNGNLFGRGLADAAGAFSIELVQLADNYNYVVYAKATDGAGNPSAASAPLTFSVDATPPLEPTGTLELDGSGAAFGNQPVFSGTAEAGTMLDLVENGHVVGHTQVQMDGSWSLACDPLDGGAHSITLLSTDLGGNSIQAFAPLAFSVIAAVVDPVPAAVEPTPVTVVSPVTSANDTPATPAVATGTDGNDTFQVGSGSHALSGLGGIDTAVFADSHANYTIQASADGFSLSANNGAVRDSLQGIERLHFSDVSLALDLEGHGGQAYRVYQAAFDRTPDQGGVGFWIAQMDRGVSLHDVAAGFLQSAEFATVYGANPTTTAFVNALYENVLHRALDQAGFDFWVSAIDQHGVERADVLSQFSESGENQAQVIGVIAHGFAYLPFG